MCVCVCIYDMQVAKLFREKETTNSKGGTRKGESGSVEGHVQNTVNTFTG